MYYTYVICKQIAYYKDIETPMNFKHTNSC